MFTILQKFKDLKSHKITFILQFVMIAIWYTLSIQLSSFSSKSVYVWSEFLSFLLVLVICYISSTLLPSSEDVARVSELGLFLLLALSLLISFLISILFVITRENFSEVIQVYKSTLAIFALECITFHWMSLPD